jgi:hypothetical protein
MPPFSETNSGIDTSYTDLDLDVVGNIREMKTDIRWIRDALKEQQELDKQRALSCIECKKETNRRIVPLETFKTQQITTNKILMAFLTLIGVPVVVAFILEVIKRFYPI